ncbi:MAG: hypothetical protein QME52_08125 [Bacteroidota bacterium]|nr:hypothetical protein [Bacteroidota bacterium]
MTVVVKYDQEGKPQYRSAKGVGSTEAERARARQLDYLLKKELSSLKKHLSKTGLLKKNIKGNVALYWEMGIVFRKVFFKSGLIDSSEKHLYWLNARLHAPEELMAKDRGPNRMHLEYCFRLAGFSKDKAMKMKWGEWVYLFDSPGINREPRFDKWLEKEMQYEPNKFSRDDIRILTQSINKLLGNIETKDLSDTQLMRCYNSAWSVKEIFITKTSEIQNDPLKEILKRGIEKWYTKLGDVIDGKITEEEFAQLVSQVLN